MFSVYLITCNHPSYGEHAMGYVGCCPSGKTVQERFVDHLRGQGGASYLRNAIQKHGKEFFSVEQIDAGNAPEQAFELEKWWIKRLGTKSPHGYNLTDGGDGIPGYKHSEETKKKMVENRTLTEEGRQALSENIKQLWNDPEFKEKRHQGMFGHFVSEEAKQKLSVSNHPGVSRWTDADKIRIKEQRAEQVITAKHKARTSASLKKYRVSHPESYAATIGSFEIQSKGGQRGSHVRWHVSKNIVSLNCELCSGRRVAA